MTLICKAAQKDGWGDQAQHLAVTHSAVGVAMMAAAEQARRRPLLGRGRSRNGDAEHDTELQPDDSALADELAATRARLAEAQRQLAREMSAAPVLRRHMEGLNEQVAAADARAADLAGELGAAQEEILRLENENRSLQKSLDLSLGENTNQSQQVATADAAVGAARTQLEDIKTALAAAQAERDKLAAAVDGALEKRWTEANSLKIRLDAMAARATAAEAECGKLTAALADAGKNHQAEVEALHARVDEQSGRLATAEAERNGLSTALAAAVDRHRSETEALNARLDAAAARLGAVESECKALAAAADAAGEARRRDKESFDSRLEAAASRAVGAEAERDRLAAALAAANETLRRDKETADARVAAMASRVAAAEAERDKLAVAIEAANETLRHDKGTIDARLQAMTSRAAGAEAERDRLAAALDAADLRRRSETDALGARVEAMAARAIAAEKALAEHLIAYSQESDVAERAVAQAAVTRNDAGKQLDLIADALQMKEREIQDLEQSQAKLIEGTNALLATFKARDTALTHTGDRVKFLIDRVTQLEAELSQAKSKEKVLELNVLMQCDRLERSIAEAQRSGLAAHDAEPHHAADDSGAGNGGYLDRVRMRSSDTLLAATLTF